MNKILVALVAVAVLAGCQSGPDESDLMTMVNWEAIEADTLGSFAIGKCPICREYALTINHAGVHGPQAMCWNCGFDLQPYSDFEPASETDFKSRMWTKIDAAPVISTRDSIVAALQQYLVPSNETAVRLFHERHREQPAVEIFQ